MALNVGIVGMRGIGARHAQTYLIDELASLVAVCDLKDERADSGAERFGVNAYHSLKDMLDGEPELDIVDVCTGGAENGSWHYEPAMEAMDAGKHVLVEKPLSNDINEAREMVAKATQKNVTLACNVNHYFTEPAARGKQYIDDGEIGELVYCLTKMGFQGGEVADYKAPRNPNAAGYPYFHLKAFLTHPFSVMRYYCGDATHVQAFLGQPAFRRDAGDPTLSTASVHVRFDNGAVGYLLSQRGDASYGLGGWWSVEVAGTKGTFCVENCVEKVSYWKAHDPRGPGRPAEIPSGEDGSPIVTESGSVAFDKTFQNRIHAFLVDVSNGTPPALARGSGRDALAALEYTFAVIESYEKGGALVEPRPLPPLNSTPS